MNSKSFHSLSLLVNWVSFIQILVHIPFFFAQRSGEKRNGEAGELFRKFCMANRPLLNLERLRNDHETSRERIRLIISRLTLIREVNWSRR